MVKITMRWKIFITIVLAALTFWITQVKSDRAQLCAVPVRGNLHAVYVEFNGQYFNNRLPKNIVIDYSEAGDFMATTMLMTDGRYHIAFNEKYVTAKRVERETLLHEMCHVRTFAENDLLTGNHGPRWRTCMLNLDLQGAFRRELIDFYEGP